MAVPRCLGERRNARKMTASRMRPDNPIAHLNREEGELGRGDAEGEKEAQWEAPMRGLPHSRLSRREEFSIRLIKPRRVPVRFGDMEAIQLISAN